MSRSFREPVKFRWLALKLSTNVRVLDKVSQNQHKVRALETRSYESYNVLSDITEVKPNCMKIYFSFVKQF
jgi:hypothetical protein